MIFLRVVPYELKLLITHCMQQKYFSSDLLNDRLERFDFVRDKPSLIDVNLYQIMSVSRIILLVIGDKVPESDENWISFH